LELVRGVDFAPDTQEPDAVEEAEDGAGGDDFVPDSEEDSDDVGLFPYDSDEVQFVPDSVIGAEEEFVPESIVEDDDDAEEPAGGQLDDNEVCFSMLRILLPAYFRIPGNENLGL
jgi:hypothetical protein